MGEPDQDRVMSTVMSKGFTSAPPMHVYTSLAEIQMEMSKAIFSFWMKSFLRT